MSRIGKSVRGRDSKYISDCLELGCRRGRKGYGGSEGHKDFLLYFERMKTF